MMSFLFLQPCITCLVRVTWMVRGCAAAVLCDVASGICSKQHLAFFCCSYQVFFPCIPLASIWCIHTVVMTATTRKKSHFILSGKSYFYMIYNQSIGAPVSGKVAKVLDCDMAVSEFNLQSCYCIHFLTNTLWKRMNLLISLAMS